MGEVNGLPAHILLVHAVVVLLPLNALLLVLTAVWQPVRQRLAAPNALLSLAVLILVPMTTSAGEWLEHRIPEDPLLRAHTELGDTALFYAIPLTILTVVVWWRQREAATPDRKALLAPTSGPVTGVIAALAVVAAVAGVYGTYRIGDSGARAAWSDGFSSTPVNGGPEGD